MPVNVFPADSHALACPITLLSTAIGLTLNFIPCSSVVKLIGTTSGEVEIFASLI
jgi:hypothetical protein